jgi:hypothetical protein
MYHIIRLLVNFPKYEYYVFVGVLLNCYLLHGERVGTQFYQRKKKN